MKASITSVSEGKSRAQGGQPSYFLILSVLTPNRQGAFTEVEVQILVLNV